MLGNQEMSTAEIKQSIQWHFSRRQKKTHLKSKHVQCTGLSTIFFFFQLINHFEESTLDHSYNVHKYIVNTILLFLELKIFSMNANCEQLSSSSLKKLGVGVFSTSIPSMSVTTCTLFCKYKTT